jgi:carbonic anhydrase
VNRAPASVRKEDELPNPDGSYTELVRGNERFATGTAKGDHRDEARRRSLASGQNPFAVILSCSDSRVPPELIFDQGLGDLYTIRVSGNVLGSAQVASIEYAVETLGAKIIVVMGHESCSAVKAALSPGKTGSTDQDWLASAIRPNLKGLGTRGIASYDSKIRIPVKANIDAVTENLVVRSAIISKAVSGGKLRVVRGIYSLDTGRVDFWSGK